MNDLVVARGDEIDGGILFGGLHEIYKCLNIYVYEYICMLILLSSPYLLVFGDDRVRGTREQMMLMQVVMVMLSHGAGKSFGVYIFSCFMILA